MDSSSNKGHKAIDLSKSSATSIPITTIDNTSSNTVNVGVIFLNQIFFRELRVETF